ncbi:MAG: DUF3617 domain-containing protein [Acidobacteria bacterium]|nr:DUF3617 domain-containing protein [Acidobacteriota bacterium]
MKTILLALILTFAAGAWAADKVQPMNVKTGLWEVTATTTRAGTPPIPPEYLARLTPEQRAKVEERMKANSGEKTITNTYKSCVTKDDLENGPKWGPKQDDACTRTVVSSTGTKMELHGKCEYENMKYDGTMLIEALSTESAKGSTKMTASGGNNTMNANSTFTAKWLAPECGETK